MKPFAGLVTLMFAVIFVSRVESDQRVIYSCTWSDRSYRIANRCESDDVMVEERTFPVRHWCIVVNNRQNSYTGQILEIKLNGDGYGVSYMTATQLPTRGFNKLPFRLNPGYNRIGLYSYGSGYSSFPNINSISISGQPLCSGNIPDLSTNEISNRFTETLPDQLNSGIQTNNGGNRYSFLNDCTDKAETLAFTTWCPHLRMPADVFNVEKFNLNGVDYWCLGFGRDKLNRGLKTMVVRLRGLSKSYSWWPAHATDSNDPRNTITQNLFQIGTEPTFIEFSPYRKGSASPEIESITIDGQDICQYYEPLAESPTISRVSPSREEVPIPLPPPTEVPIVPIISTTERPLFPAPTESSPRSERTPAETTCGRIPMNFHERIAFGTQAEQGAWPWHAAIFYTVEVSARKSETEYICGGTLITANAVLTAAHCLIDVGGLKNMKAFTIKLGLYNLDEDTDVVQSISVSRMTIHTNYNPETYEHDIGFFQLKRKAQMDEWVQIICMPTPNFRFVKHVGEIVGWGANESGQLQTMMQHASIPVVDRQTCLESNRDHFGQYLTRTNFCAGNRNMTNVCSGDSGSGLVFSNQSIYVIGGITSLASGVPDGATIKCDLQQYVLYTDVSKYTKWVSDQMIEADQGS